MPFINGIGPGEVIIILIIALIVVGPGKLPDVGSALGKSIREFRKAATDVKESTSLDAKPAPAAPAPAQVAAPAAPVVTVPEPAEAIPAVTSAPPVPALPAVPAAPAGALAASAAVETAANEAAEHDAEAAPASGAWPAEVTPVDEQQPTTSA